MFLTAVRISPYVCTLGGRINSLKRSISSKGTFCHYSAVLSLASNYQATGLLDVCYDVGVCKLAVLLRLVELV